MPRYLLIMRHAKSAWDTSAASDFDRPLAERGQKDAPRMGHWLRKEKLVPDVMVSSPAERARQTVIALCQSMGLKTKKIGWDPRIYGAGTEDLLEVLAEIPKRSRMAMVVGHNPGLEFLLHYLVGGSESDLYDAGLIRTATVAQVKMPEDWDNLKPGCGTLVQVKNPRDIA